MISLISTIKSIYSNTPILTVRRFVGGIFRVKRGLPASNNEWGPLTDLPDYSFLDGRIPKITSVGQKRRIIDQYMTTKQIVCLSAELHESNKKLKEQKMAAIEAEKALAEKLLKRKGSRKLDC
uniref:Large ribosomal subunit protein mL52 n=1 Tax=Mesocestoides corti TaxID=53468 RepID=A0A5K3F492_MESCO